MKRAFEMVLSGKRFVTFIAVFCLLCFTIAGCISSPVRPENFPANWATPLKAQGLDRFARVDDGLYRGKQPQSEGYENLKLIGIHSVVDLRTSDPQDEESEVTSLGMKFFHIPQSATGVDEKNIVQFLKIVTSAENRPVFVHCRQGVDRTGTNVAVYRIVVQGWSREDALTEMYGFGYNHGLWKDLEKYILSFDPVDVAQKAGLTYPMTTKAGMP